MTTTNLLAGAHPADPAPEPPERPGDNQCCQSGCEPCIFDLYAEDMQAWREAHREWELRQASRAAQA